MSSSLDDIVKVDSVVITDDNSAEVPLVEHTNSTENNMFPAGNTIPQLSESDIFKDGDTEGIRQLMAEMAAAGDPTGGLSAEVKPTQRPRSSPFHGVCLVYSRKCLWQSMLAVVVGRKVATVEVNNPGDFPGYSERAMELIKASPTTVVVGAPECARKLAETTPGTQVVSCVENPLGINSIVAGELLDNMIEESFDGLYAWLGLSPTDVYICDYMRIAAGIGKPSIYGEITAADARSLVSGLRMSGLLRDDGTGGDSPRWALGDIRGITYGARGFDNINNFVVVGQTLETHRTREFEQAVANGVRIYLSDNSSDEQSCLIVNYEASETTIALAARQHVHAVLFFGLVGDHWRGEFHPGSLPVDMHTVSNIKLDNPKITVINDKLATIELTFEEMNVLLTRHTSN